MSLATGAPLVVPSRPGVLALLAGLLLLLGLGLSVMIGPVPVGPARMIRALTGTAAADDPAVAIVRQIRIPRAALAGLVGACLALAGLGFQAISRNPLMGGFVSPGLHTLTR